MKSIFQVRQIYDLRGGFRDCQRAGSDGQNCVILSNWKDCHQEPGWIQLEQNPSHGPPGSETAAGVTLGAFLPGITCSSSMPRSQASVLPG